MPVTQRKRSLQLFRRLKFCNTTSSSSVEEPQLEIDKMILHVLDCLGALQCVMGKYDSSRAKVFWGAVSTIAEIGIDAAVGHVDKRHPGASHLLRAFPNEQKTTDGRGWLPLHWAAVLDNADVTDVRSIARADPLATVKGLNQPIGANPGHLIAAVHHPCMEVVKCLFDFYPRMASARDNEGDLPIHYAARYSESIEMIKFLLQTNPTSTKVVGEGNLVPLQCALYNESDEQLHIVKCLIDADPAATKIINSDGDTALHLAVDQECPVELLQYLIKANPEAVRTPNDIGLLPLHIACYCKHPTRAIETVKLLLAEYPEGARIAGSNEHLPIHFAAEHSTSEVLDCLIQAYPEAIHMGCAVDSNDTALFNAVSSSNEDTVQYILQHFPDCVRHRNQQQLTAMHLAAEGESLTILRMLYERYPEAITLVDVEGRTPLQIFTQIHQDTLQETDEEANCLRFLLRHYPSAVNVSDTHHETPLTTCPVENILYRRLLLQAQSHLHTNNNNSSSTQHNNYQEEFRNIKYQSRRYGMFLAFAAINADGIPNIYSKLRGKDVHLLMESLSYL